MRVEGSRVLLVGATGGIGTAVAETLHERGAALVLSDRDTAALERLAGRLGGGARTIAAELTSSAEIESLVDEAGPIDVLVESAGLPAAGQLGSFSGDEVERALDVNLRAPIELARLLYPGMASRGRGQLVFVGSIAAKLPLPATSVYNATKFGLRGFVAALRHDLKQLDVGVSLVLPGPIRDAGMWADSGVEMPRPVGLRRPHDVAAAVVKCIRRNRSEVVVAPLFVRIGSWLGGVRPSSIGAINQRFGRAVAEAAAEAMLAKR